MKRPASARTVAKAKGKTTTKGKGNASMSQALLQGSQFAARPQAVVTEEPAVQTRPVQTQAAQEGRAAAAFECEPPGCVGCSRGCPGCVHSRNPRVVALRPQAPQAVQQASDIPQPAKGNMQVLEARLNSQDQRQRQLSNLQTRMSPLAAVMFLREKDARDRKENLD